MAYFADHCLSKIDRTKTRIIYDAEAVFFEREKLERKILGKGSETDLQKSKIWGKKSS